MTRPTHNSPFRQVGLLMILLATLTSRAAENFKLEPVRKRGAEGNLVQRLLLTVQDQRFSFLPPAGWRVGTSSAEKKVMLQPKDYSATLSIQIETNDRQVKLDADDKQFIEQVLAKYPDAKIISKSTCRASEGTCLVLELERAIDANEKLGFRLAFVPWGNAWIEFCLAATPDNGKKYQLNMEQTIISFKPEASVKSP